MSAHRFPRVGSGLVIGLLCAMAMVGCLRPDGPLDEPGGDAPASGFSLLGQVRLAGPTGDRVEASAASGATSAIRAEGVSVADALVWIEELLNVAPVRTDASGFYRFDNLPPGQYRVVVRYAAGDHHYMVRGAPMPAQPSTAVQPAPVLFLMGATRFVTGILRDPAGNPLASGTTVTVWGETFVVGRDGAFTVGPLPDATDAVEIVVVQAGVPSPARPRVTVQMFAAAGPTTVDVRVGPASGEGAPIGVVVSVKKNSAPVSAANPVIVGDRIELAVTLNHVTPDTPGLTIEWHPGRGRFAADPGNGGSAVWIAPGLAGLATVSVRVSAPGRGYCQIAVPISVGSSGGISTATGTATVTGTGAFSGTGTSCQDGTGTVTFSGTGTATGALTATLTGTGAATATSTGTDSGTGTSTSTGNALATGTGTGTGTGTDAATGTGTGSSTGTGAATTGGLTGTSTGTSTGTTTATSNETGTVTATATSTGNAPATGTGTGTGTGTDAATGTGTGGSTGTGAATTGGLTGTSTGTSTGTTVATGTATSTATETVTHTGTTTATATETGTVTATATSTSTSTPTDTGVAPSLSVTFDPLGGSAVSEQTVVSGALLLSPPPPVRPGHSFGGWFREAACATAWNFAVDPVTVPITLYAKWTINRQTVSFEASGGSPVATQTVEYSATASVPIPPTRLNYGFGGWYREPTCATAWDFATDLVTTDITLYAKWTIVQRTVVYQTGVNGSLVGSTTQSIDHGGVGTPVTAIALAGYRFVNWSDGRTDNPRTETGVTADATYTASFAPISAPVATTGRFAYSENTGWLNFGDPNGSATAVLGAGGSLTGFAWGEAIGWVKLAGTSVTGTPYGVSVNAAGQLSGFAYSETTGWINFGATGGDAAIDLGSGALSGFAWGENIGWIKLSGTAGSGTGYGVQLEMP